MFYYSKWHRLCSTISRCRLTACTASESLALADDRHFIVLKHDVEADVPKAHHMAMIEHAHGIRGSYYVQACLLQDPHNVALLKAMTGWGHEVSYHYDVLDANNGDYARAERDFDRNLDMFARHGFVFRTVCQHGNPVKRRVGYTSNRDFFRHPDIRQRHPGLVDMVVDYSRHVHDSYFYISDAGYRWSLIADPENNDIRHVHADVTLDGFDALLSMMQGGGCSRVISTHPHRWCGSAWQAAMRVAAFRTLRGAARMAGKVPLLHTLLDRYYFLAKKI